VSGFEQIDRMVVSLKTLDKLGEKAAEDVARVVESELRRTIAAGTTPDGKPWQPTEAGERPLRNAAGALGIAAVGSTVYVRLTGPEARHHKGRARGGIVREVIPTRGIPDAMAEHIRAVLAEHYERHMRGGDGN
jgi:hypothetical protein